MGDVGLFCRETDQEAFGHVEKLAVVTFAPLLELASSSLHKDSHHALPVVFEESLGVVGDVEPDLSLADDMLKLDPLLETCISCGLFVGPPDEELLDVAEAEVAGVELVRHNDYWVLLLLQQHVHPHLLLLSIHRVH